MLTFPACHTQFRQSSQQAERQAIAVRVFPFFISCFPWKQSVFASLPFIPGSKIRSERHRRSRLLSAAWCLCLRLVTLSRGSWGWPWAKHSRAPLKRSRLVLGLASTCTMCCCSVDHSQGKCRWERKHQLPVPTLSIEEHISRIAPAFKYAGGWCWGSSMNCNRCSNAR